MSDESATILEGELSVRAALESQNRQIYRLLIHQKKQYDKRLSHLRNLVKKAHVPIEYIDAETIESHANGKTHGGVLALAGERRFVDLAELLPSDHVPWIAMLDGVEDPFNFGYAIRSLYAAGVDGLVVRPRNWMTATATVARASAGTSERIPMAIAETAEDAAAFYRTHDLKIACTAKEERALTIYEANLSLPLFILIGGERRGITRSFVEQADILLQIPYGRDFRQSLGTVGATSVLAFEIMRQRRTTGRA